MCWISQSTVFFWYQLLSNRNGVKTIMCHRNATELNLLFQGERKILYPPNYTFSLAICHLTESKPNLQQEKKHSSFHAVYQRKNTRSCPMKKGRQSHHVIFYSHFTYDGCVGFSSHYLFSSLKVCCLHSCDWGLVKQTSWMFGEQMRHKSFIIFFF